MFWGFELFFLAPVSYDVKSPLHAEACLSCRFVTGVSLVRFHYTRFKLQAPLVPTKVLY